MLLGELTRFADYHRARDELMDCLTALAKLPLARETLLSERQGQTPTAAAYLTEAVEKLRTNAFLLAVVGEYSTGKSSLLNVLLDQLDPEEKSPKPTGLLPTQVNATTAAITILQAGEKVTVEVRLRDGHIHEVLPEELARFVASPNAMEVILRRLGVGRMENLSEQVEEVRIWCPSPLLQEGIRIVDTPGLGSVYTRHREVTTHFIPRADAVLFLTSTSAPLGESEKTFLQYVVGFTQKFFFVQTMRDQGDREERGEPIYRRVERQTRQHLEEVLEHADFPYFVVSARDAAIAFRQNDPERKARSGIPVLREALERFLVEQRGAPRLQQQIRASLYVLDLLDLRARNLLEDLETSPEAPAAPSEPPEAEELFRQFDQLLRDYHRELRTTALQKLRDAFSEMEDRVVKDTEAKIISLGLQQVQENASARAQVEREMVHSIQHHVRIHVAPILQASSVDALDAVEKIAQQQLPSNLRRFQTHSKFLAGEDISLNLDQVVQTRMETKQRHHQTEGALIGGGGLALLGGALFGPIGALVGALLGGIGGSEVGRNIETSYDSPETSVQHDLLKARVHETISHLQQNTEDTLSDFFEELDMATQGELERLRQTERTHAEEVARLRAAEQEERERQKFALRRQREQLQEIRGRLVELETSLCTERA